MSDAPYIALSGGFDPMQVGHVRMIDDASVFGRVIIFLNSDDWLIRKKNYCFMPFAERKELLESIRNVSLVLPAMDKDDTVRASIEMFKETIQYFGNGGDRWHANTPEAELCHKYGIQVIYGLGGLKVQSSSELVRNVLKN